MRATRRVHTHYLFSLHMTGKLWIQHQENSKLQIIQLTFSMSSLGRR